MSDLLVFDNIRGAQFNLVIKTFCHKYVVFHNVVVSLYV